MTDQETELDLGAVEVVDVGVPAFDPAADEDDGDLVRQLGASDVDGIAGNESEPTNAD